MPYEQPTRHKEYLNASALARRLGISRATLYVYMRKGKLPEPDRHETTNYPRWRIEDVSKIQEMLREGAGQ
jgi:predicted site-specific integrase-resolvase